MKGRGFIPPFSFDDLEYRVASLEQLTRGLGIGQELTVGSLYALGRISGSKIAEVRIADRFSPGSSGGQLEGAVDNLAGSDGVIFCPPGAYSIADNYTVPSTVHLAIAKGAVLTVASGKTLTINGTFEAGLFQVFTCVGTGKVVFGYAPATVENFYPQWWGAKGDDSVDDTDAIMAAIIAALDRIVILVSGTYKVGNGTTHKYITLKGGASIEGSGVLTVLKPTHVGTHYPVFVNQQTGYCRFFSVRNLLIDFSNCNVGTDPSTHAPSGAWSFGPATAKGNIDGDVGFMFIVDGSAYLWEYRIENVRIDYAYAAYVDYEAGYLTTLANVFAHRCYYGFWKKAGTTTHFENCDASGTGAEATTGMGWYLENVSAVVLTACAMEGYYSAISAYFLNCNGFAINGFDFEANATPDSGYAQIFQFENCKCFTINGLTGWANHLHCADPYQARIIHVASCVGAIKAVTLGSVQGDDTDAGDGIVVSLLVSGDSFIEVAGCLIDTVAGGTPTKYALGSLANPGSSIVEIGCEILTGGGGTARWDPGDTMCRVMGATGVEDT